ncbi:hypothetical protein EXIGLDRAFT_716464 [Exidia glandulosa HHB12029]|uniref:Protein kinase domain-containing protein n=1 Tax=Exidia glandulosa HHB12029 TaxID=1314781 RepID=A0A165P8X6_EXIGL|nr:hypothetical protein EXIGLDRAFT_716464 [Exidia glandulosa HHB12029]
MPRTTPRSVGPTLAALVVALKVAREATDDVPIVKQILGAAVAIVEYAEKIDKNRDAMYSLATKSATLARQIKDIVAGRTVNPLLTAHLEELSDVFKGVEDFMAKHAAVGRFSRIRRAFDHAFVVAKHVERLREELQDASQGFLIAAALDSNLGIQETKLRIAETNMRMVETNLRIAETTLQVQQNAQYDGEFRLLRFCDINKLEEIRDFGLGDRCVRYARARVDGTSGVLVLRYLDTSDGEQAAANEDVRNIIARDSILQKLSNIRNVHPNIARLYGWGTGSPSSRFTVFKTHGSHIATFFLSRISQSERSRMAWSMTVKSLDAARHLRDRCGIAWRPRFQQFACDDSGEPTLGIGQYEIFEELDDPSTASGGHAAFQVMSSADLFPTRREFSSGRSGGVEVEDLGWEDDRLAALHGCTLVQRNVTTVEKEGLTSSAAGRQEALEYISQISQAASLADNEADVQAYIQGWAKVLNCLADPQQTASKYYWVSYLVQRPPIADPESRYLCDGVPEVPEHIDKVRTSFTARQMFISRRRGWQ